jgi:hypothetical protein
MNWKKKTLNDITFPVCAIKQYREIWEESKIVYITTSKGTTKILDNKNLPGSFGIRRARMPKKLLYKLQALPSIKSLIKEKSLTHLYVDHTGELFEYRKNKYCPLVCKKVLERKQKEGVGYIITIEGVDTPVIQPAVLHDPFIKYAAILETPFGQIVYEFTHEPFKNSKRMI